jgi:hypothetical protein
MEKDLPEASPRFCNFLWQEGVIRAGMNLSQQDVLFLGRLASAYFKTPEGIQTALSYLKIKAKPASILQTYFKAGFSGQEDKRIKSTDLMRIEGWIWRGVQAVPQESVAVDEREDANVCDNCGGSYPVDYCMKQVEAPKQNGTLRVEQWCNRCRYQTEDQRIRQTGDQKRCGACEKVICEFNPKHAELLPNNVTRFPQQRMLVGGAVPPLPPGWE